VLVWAVAFVAGLVATTHVPGELKGGGFTNPTTPSQQAQKAMQERLGFGPARLTIVFTSPSLDARSSAFRAPVKAALAGLDREAFPKLLSVQTAASTGDAGFISRDGHATFAVLSFDASSEQVQRMIPAVRARLAPTGLTTYLTGDPAVYADIEQISAEDLRTAETYTLPIAIIVLVLIFGTLVAAALPVIGGGMAVTVTLGVFWVLAQFLDISVFAMNVATLLGLAVGIDYSLFMVGRFREELSAGHTVAEAVEITVEHAGRSIFFSGLTVVVGLLGLVVIPFMSMRSMGLGGALVVIFSVLAALTLLPALLGMLGARVDRLRVIGRSGKQGAFWARWSDWVMHHPVPVLVGTLIVVLLFAWPVLHIEREIPGATALPQRSESRQGYDILQSRFDVSALSPIYVLATWSGDTGALEPANLQRLCGYGKRLQAMPGVARVTSVVNLPGIETPEAAARRRRPSRPAPGSARRPAAPGCAGPELPHHGSRHGALPGRPQGRPDLRGGAGSRRAHLRAASSPRHERPRRRHVHERVRLRPHPVPALPLDHPVRGLRHRPRAPPAPAQRVPAGQGGDHERPVAAGRLRGRGVDLPGRPSRVALQLQEQRRHRRRAAGDPLLHRVRRLDGLRSVPAYAHARSVG
jgi:RND superfamily putative drug exporter